MIQSIYTEEKNYSIKESIIARVNKNLPKILQIFGVGVELF